MAFMSGSLTHLIAVIEPTSTLYHTGTLINVPVTIASATKPQTTGIAAPAAVSQPYAWRGGGDTLTPPVVAVVKSLISGLVSFDAASFSRLSKVGALGQRKLCATAYAAFEALKVADLNMISAYARYQQIKRQNPSSAQSEQLTATDSPQYALGFRNNAEVTSNVKSHSGVLVEAASLSSSREAVNPALGAPMGLSGLGAVQSENGGSFDTNDSALGESLSEAGAKKQEQPVPPPSLIIKFSTAGQARINAVERRGSILYPEQARSRSDHDYFLDRHQNDTSTTPAQSKKRRGRPPGSKSKNPSSKSENCNGQTGGQRQTPTPSQVQKQHGRSGPLQNNTSRILSDAMKASWAKRRHDGTDGHHGGPPTEQTILKRSRILTMPDKDHSAKIGQPKDNPRRQLFKGQHAIRSASGPKLPVLAPKPNTYNVQQTVPGGFVDTPISPIPAPVASLNAGLPSKSVLPIICKDDPALTEIFKANIYPALMKSKIRYQGTLPDTTLLAICKQVANETVDKKFQTFLRESEYQLDRRQRKRIKKYTKQKYAAKVRHTQEKIQSNNMLPSLEQRREAKNVNIAAAAESFGSQYASPTKQPIATALHERNEASRHHGMWKVGRADSENERPREAKPTARKLRGHVRTSKVVDPAKEDLAQDIDWYDTLYPGHTSQRPRSPQLIGPLHKKLPSAFNPELELAAVNASLCESDRPYKSSRRGHYDFVREEYLSLFYAMDSFDRAPYQVYDADTPDLRRQLKTRLGQASEERMTAIIKAAHSKPGTVLEHRKKKHIRAFIIDLTEDAIPLSAQPRLAIPSLDVKDKVLDTKHTTGSLLRNRELGHESPAQGINIQSALHQRFAETIRPWRSWKGASSDVVTVAWAPDSLLYAAGAAAQSDDNDLQYNRPHNLLVGDLRLNTISELPDHRVARPRPETVASGPNSSYAVYQACDPMVYKTVTSVQFSPWGGTLYTASHDKTVKIWDTSSGLPTCSASLSHDAEVTSLELSTHCPGYFATASKTIDGSVRVYQPAQQGSQDGLLKMNFSSSRALKHRNHDVYPECIRWGLTPGTKHLLLAGFQQWADHEYSAARQGQVCLWDVNTGVNINVRPHASAIFSVAWHPQEDIFITGGAPGGGPLSFPRTTKSVVRSYDTRNTSSYIHEFECPALDMQDVTLHPNSSNYVTAGCTDGTTYVWDFRWPDEIMHELHHGKPLQELAANEEELPYIEHRESLDAGVMLSIWGKGASLFYTGSSDGVIKAWDILRAPEDVWVRDVARLPAGVQSGALSPDGMNLLVGDAVGGVHVLSAAPFGLLHPDRNDDADGRDYKPDPIKFVYADEKKDHSEVDNPGTEGIDVANQLMKSGQTVLHPLFGVGKGPNYQGPLAKSARWNNIVSGFSELLPAFDRQQAFSVDGREQTEFSEKIRTLVAARKEQMVAGKQDSKPFTIVLGPPTPFVANRGTSAKPTPNYARASAPDLAQNRTLSAYTRQPSPSPSAPKTSRMSASGKIPPAACSPPRAIAREIVDLTDEYFISPSTGSKRRRASTASTAQPSTPTHASKRIKLEYVSPLQYPFQSPKPVRTTGVAVVDLTDDGVSEQATAIYLGSEGVYDVNANFAGEGAYGRMVPKKKKKGVVDLSGKEGVEEEGNLLTWEEWVKEDHWWPKGC
ncbi:MAG: hypothetical protein Q9196_000355 [Gyalolechia fulgens]